jgi:archaemetzincin
MTSIIYVAPLHRPADGAVSHILRRLPGIFGIPAETIAPRIDLRGAFNSARRQYQSAVILAELLGRLPSPDAKLIAVTDVDLYIPVLTFVFGEAQLKGAVAVASSHRLHNSFYGLPEDDGLFLSRLEKEVVHELGHTFNLKHCENYSCVMHSSTYVEDIDLKKPEFCGECRNRMEW